MKLALEGLKSTIKMTTDIFSNTILCGKCNSRMEKIQIARNGFILRAVSCPKCASKIIHPKDEQEYNDFVDLKKKEFTVKMRYVGNSYAVSIPKEIVNFIHDQEKIMDDMVRLCLEDFGKISLEFGNHSINSNGNNHQANGNKINNEANKIKEN